MNHFEVQQIVDETVQKVEALHVSTVPLLIAVHLGICYLRLFAVLVQQVVMLTNAYLGRGQR